MTSQISPLDDAVLSVIQQQKHYEVTINSKRTELLLTGNFNLLTCPIPEGFKGLQGLRGLLLSQRD